MAQAVEQSPVTKVTLKAPLTGFLLPIESVPDPVFAQKMVGDGISVDPVDQYLLAPCDGEVLQLHSAGHALTLGVAGGLEIMIHIGLNTVELNGEGFRPRVKAGDRVKSGDLLIEFDADYIATHATSLLTQVVVTNSELVSRFQPGSGQVKAGEDDILVLWLGQQGAAGADAIADSAGQLTPSPTVHRDAQRSEASGSGAPLVPIALQSQEISIANKSGLHARPAAVLASLAKKFKADIRLQRGADSVDAKSVVAIMQLEVGYRDRVKLLAQGEDAGEALGKLVQLLASSAGESGALAASPADTSPGDASPSRQQPADDSNVLRGQPASRGMAIGKICQLRFEQPAFEEFGRNAHDEQRCLDVALREAAAQLESLQARVRREAGEERAAIFAAHEALLDDPCLLEPALEAIAAGKSAAWAWQNTIDIHAQQLAHLNNPVLAERATDLKDLGRRVLYQLLGGSHIGQQSLPENSILVAEELTPSIIASLDRDRVRGFCTVMGSASSHVAILARSLDLPAVAGVDARALDIEDGTPAIIDGDQGTLRIDPSEAQMQEAQARQQSSTSSRQQELQSARDPAITRNGVRVEVVANVGSLDDIRQAVGLGAEGVGLLRTEFMFMHRESAPTEEEQLRFYRDIAAFLGRDQLLVIRTLDVGGDKPLSYLPMPREDNPFLGERGIRISLDRPDLFCQQVRAILRAADDHKLALLLPMVSNLDELREAKSLIEAQRRDLGAAPVPVGIMVEVPSVALLARKFAAEADFFSIGTNDLVQYTMAVDRDHPRLATTLDSLNPAVLQLISATVRAASEGDTWVNICGTVASDPQAVPALLGLGLTRLSCSAPSIPTVKARIRVLDLDECRELAQQALQLESAAAVRALFKGL